MPLVLIATSLPFTDSAVWIGDDDQESLDAK